MNTSNPQIAQKAALSVHFAGEALAAAKAAEKAANKLVEALSTVKSNRAFAATILVAEKAAAGWEMVANTAFILAAASVSVDETAAAAEEAERAAPSRGGRRTRRKNKGGKKTRRLKR